MKQKVMVQANQNPPEGVSLRNHKLPDRFVPSIDPQYGLFHRSMNHIVHVVEDRSLHSHHTRPRCMDAKRRRRMSITEQATLRGLTFKASSTEIRL